MNKPNITQGEWRFIKPDDDFSLCLVNTEDEMTVHDGFDFANAKAISAVPEMIDTLFDCRSNIIQSQKFHGTSGSKLLEKINKTLKKAGCTDE